MKAFITIAILMGSAVSALASVEGSTVLRCKDSAGQVETVQVNFVRYKEGVLKLYNYDVTGAAVESKSYDSTYSCIIEGKILQQMQ